MDLTARQLAVLLASMVALSPLAVDAYLPALPTMATELGTTVNILQTSLSTYLGGLGLGLLLGGPLSDHYGRRLVGKIGIFIFMVISLAIALIHHAEAIIVLRFVQAFGGGCLTVIAPAFVRDRYDGKEAARIFALIGLIMAVAPLLAPAIGAVILTYFGWEWIFVFLGAYALLILIVVMPRLPERRIKVLSAISPRQVFKDYWGVLTHKSAMGYLLTQSFAIGVMFVFLTSSSYTYIEYFGVSEGMFPVYFGMNMVAAMLLNRLNPFLLKFLDPHQILGIGLCSQFLTVVALAFLTLAGRAEFVFVVPLIVGSVGAAGLIMPNCMTCFISNFPEKPGTANALFGTSQYVIGGCLGALASAFHTGNILPMSLMMLVGSVTALGAYTVLAGGRLRMPALQRDGQADDSRQ
tara:strand:- start:29612 stop:30838 length:1227 start_codon:yes stop_codon:yes gene_type:complete